MTPLRQRMIADLQLRGLSARTQETSVRAVRQLAEQDHTSPDRIWVTHRLETGVNLRRFQAYLGHHSPAPSGRIPRFSALARA